MQAFQKNMVTITQALSKALMKELGATNIKPVSARTLQFDCTPKADGTNRIKVTVEGGKFQVRGYKVEETDLLYAIEPDSLATALKNLGGALPNIPTTF
jgi:hypothetical protein